MTEKKLGIMDRLFGSGKSTPTTVASGSYSAKYAASERKSQNCTSSTINSTRNRGLNAIIEAEFQENKGDENPESPTSESPIRAGQKLMFADVHASSSDPDTPSSLTVETSRSENGQEYSPCENNPSKKKVTEPAQAQSTPWPSKNYVATTRRIDCFQSLFEGMQPISLTASPLAGGLVTGRSGVTYNNTRRRSSVGKAISRRKSLGLIKCKPPTGSSSIKVDTNKPLGFPATPETIYEYHRLKPFLNRNEEWLIIELNEYECLVGSMDIIKVIAEHSQFYEVEPDELWPEFFEFVEDIASYDDIITYDIWQEFRDERYSC